MDELSESIGKLSTNAKEWRPGQSFTLPTTPASDRKYPSRTTSTPTSTSSPWGNPNSPSFGTATTTTRASSFGTIQNTSGSGSGSGSFSWDPKKTKEFVPQSSRLQPKTKEFIPQSARQQQETQIPVQQLSQEPIHNTASHEEMTPIGSAAATATTSSITSPAAEAMASHPAQTFTSNNPLTQPMHKTIHSLGLPNHTLWSIYRSIALDCANEMEPNDARYKAIPPEFVNAMPLEEHDQTKTNINAGNNTSTNTSNPMTDPNASQTLIRSSFGYHTSIFKVTSTEDGRLYCLRRFDNVKGTNQKIALTITNAWARAMIHIKKGNESGSGKPVLQHPGIVRLFKCFYQNRAVFFIHEYFPLSLTLRECLYGLGRGMGGVVTPGMTREGFRPLDELTIWSYVTQLVSALRAIHRGNLACRTLQLNHILVSPDVGSGIDERTVRQGHLNLMGESMIRSNRVRLRINCVGVVDALEFEAGRSIEELQVEDMRCLGRIILSLVTGTEIGNNVNDETLLRCDAYMRQNYSQELHTLAMALVARPRPSRLGMIMVEPPRIDEVCRAVAIHALDEMDSAHAVIDGMDEALASEYDSGRALRLLLKLGFINERPEFGVDPRWSESGDCYVLKLFRDYVFHQADASGRPVMDLGHVVTSLNKLDAGDEEKIVLASRNGKSIMVVSYADIGRCLENAYAELCGNSVPNQQTTYIHMH